MAAGNATQQRERRVVLSGAVVLAIALIATYAVLPFARQWRDREREIVQARERVALLAGLEAARPDLEAGARSAEASLAGRATRLFHARSLTLAASALQSLLQDVADASQLVVTRLDVAPNANANGAGSAGVSLRDGIDAPAALSLPATLAAYTDIVGLAALLDHLARAPRVVRVEKLTVQQNSALRGAPDMLQITLTIRAPVVLE